MQQANIWYQWYHLQLTEPYCPDRSEWNEPIDNQQEQLPITQLNRHYTSLRLTLIVPHNREQIMELPSIAISHASAFIIRATSRLDTVPGRAIIAVMAKRNVAGSNPAESDKISPFWWLFSQADEFVGLSCWQTSRRCSSRSRRRRRRLCRCWCRCRCWCHSHWSLPFVLNKVDALVSNKCQVLLRDKGKR